MESRHMMCDRQPYGHTDVQAQRQETIHHELECATPSRVCTVIPFLHTMLMFVSMNSQHGCTVCYMTSMP